MTDFAIRTFLTLFVVVDPVGLAPTFVALAGKRTAEERGRVARKAVFVAGGVLLVFTLGGARLLSYLGTTLDAFRVAGGILLFRMAVGMIYAQSERKTKEEDEEAMTREDIGVFPLGIPLIAGPGALASVMILAGEARSRPGGLAMVLGMVAAVLVLTYLGFHLAGTVTRVLGQTGVNVVTRVLGLLLAALAIQYVADGARGLINLSAGTSATPS